MLVTWHWMACQSSNTLDTCTTNHNHISNVSNVVNMSNDMLNMSVAASRLHVGVRHCWRINSTQSRLTELLEWLEAPL